MIFEGKIDNVGPVYMDVTVADFTFGGQTQSFLGQVIPSRLEPGQHEFIRPQFTLNVCQNGLVDAEFLVRASPPNGSDCQDSVVLNFSTKFIAPPTYR